MAARKLPDIQTLRDALEIDPLSPTGLTWKHRDRSQFLTNRGFLITNQRFAGKIAGKVSASGDGHPQCVVGFGLKRYQCHRIIYAIHYGVDPYPHEIDHIDRNSLNNDPLNLRIAGRSENAFNKNKQANNTSGIRGVTYCKRTKMWMAQIGKNGKCLFLGRYKEKSDAEKARKSVEKTLFNEFAP